MNNDTIFLAGNGERYMIYKALRDCTEKYISEKVLPASEDDMVLVTTYNFEVGDILLTPNAIKANLPIRFFVASSWVAEEALSSKLKYMAVYTHKQYDERKRKLLMQLAEKKEKSMTEQSFDNQDTSYKLEQENEYTSKITISGGTLKVPFITKIVSKRIYLPYLSKIEESDIQKVTINNITTMKSIKKDALLFYYFVISLAPKDTKFTLCYNRDIYSVLQEDFIKITKMQDSTDHNSTKIGIVDISELTKHLLLPF